VLDRIPPVDFAAADSGGITARLRDAERTLERSKRDLAEAMNNARRLEQQIAEARRRIEQSRWVNAATDNPELAREASIRLAAQTAVIETQEKSVSDIAARVTRLQSRVERQSTRVFDLQNQRPDENAVDAARDAADESNRGGRKKLGPRDFAELGSRESADATLWPRLWRTIRGADGHGRA
jgi:phage shock protein A